MGRSWVWRWAGSGKRARADRTRSRAGRKAGAARSARLYPSGRGPDCHLSLAIQLDGRFQAFGHIDELVDDHRLVLALYLQVVQLPRDHLVLDEGVGELADDDLAVVARRVQ